MSDKLPDELPPLRDIHRAKDFMSGSSFANLCHYRMNLTDHAELRRQVDELLQKSFIREFKSLCRARVIHTKEEW